MLVSALNNYYRYKGRNRGKIVFEGQEHMKNTSVKIINYGSHLNSY